MTPDVNSVGRRHIGSKNGKESAELFVFPNFAPHFTDFLSCENTISLHVPLYHIVSSQWRFCSACRVVMEPNVTAATQTFRSQAEMIMELAVESAVSVLDQRLGQEETDSQTRRVRNQWLVHNRVVK